jgi:hypothetical protein
VGRHLSYGRGRGQGRLPRAGCGAVLGGRVHVARAGADRCRRGCDRDRQLVGVADGSAGAARGVGGQPARARVDPEGDRGQPQLHDDGRDARTQGALRRGRPALDGRGDVSGGVGVRVGRCFRAGRSGTEGRRAGRVAHARRWGGGVSFAVEVRGADRVQRAAAGRRAGGRRQRGDGRGAEAPEREPEDPRTAGSAGVGDVCASAGVHGALAVDQRGVRTGDQRGTGSCCGRRRASWWPTCRRR